MDIDKSLEILSKEFENKTRITVEKFCRLCIKITFLSDKKMFLCFEDKNTIHTSLYDSSDKEIMGHKSNNSLEDIIEDIKKNDYLIL